MNTSGRRCPRRGARRGGGSTPHGQSTSRRGESVPSAQEVNGRAPVPCYLSARSQVSTEARRLISTVRACIPSGFRPVDCSDPLLCCHELGDTPRAIARIALARRHGVRVTERMSVLMDDVWNSHVPVQVLVQCRHAASKTCTIVTSCQRLFLPASGSDHPRARRRCRAAARSAGDGFGGFSSNSSTRRLSRALKRIRS